MEQEVASTSVRETNNPYIAQLGDHADIIQRVETNTFIDLNQFEQ